MTDVLDDHRLKPLVMIVEDVPEHLDTRKELFESFDCLAIGATSKSSAIRELSHTPRPDLVVTDIHMPEGPDDTDDVSGYELAKYIRANYKGLPVAGYSAFFADSELSGEVHSAFDEVFPKGAGGAGKLRGQVERCVHLAMESRENRLAEFLDRMDTLRDEYVAKVPPAEVRRRLALDPDAEKDGSRVEGKLGEAGYRLRVVSVPDRSSREPMIVWSIRDSTGYYVEAYGRPELYAHGDSENLAVERLAELLSLFESGWK